MTIHHALQASLLATTLVLVLSINAEGASIKSPTAYDSLDDWTVITDDVAPEVLFKRVQAYSDQQAKLNGAPDDAPKTLAGPFSFPKNAQFDNGKPRLNSIFGVDISHYTPSSIKLGELRGSLVTFVYMKATQGVGYKDSKFTKFWSTVGQLPTEQSLYRGAYHFLSAKGDGASQGESFAKFVFLNETTGNDLPPVVDLEWDVAKANGPDRWRGHSAKDIVASAVACLRAIEDAYRAKGIPKTPILYTSVAWLQERGITEADFAPLAHYPVWIADYSRSHRAIEVPNPVYGRAPQFWQFSSTAAAVNLKTIDANVFKGTEGDFKAAFQLPE